jgi:dethiobiotin synthetase
MRGLFIAGTDTSVGKTFVAAALCLALRRRGAAVVGLKPFETGCDPVAEDAAALESAARSGLSLTVRCPFRYRLPLAPAAAGERRGDRRGPSLQTVATLVRSAAHDRFAVVEAAGGLLVPISGKKTNLDLAAELRLPVVLVGRNGLGTINHTCLSVAALRERRLRIAAIVLSRGHLPRDASQADNALWIQRLTGISNVVDLPRTSRAGAAAVLRRRLAPSLGAPT